MTSNDERLLAEEVNRRYWDTGQSVNQIADALGISKSALYGLLDAMPAGLACPRCGQELGYANRTAREKGFVTCVSCDFEEEVQAVPTAAAAGPPITGADLAGNAADREPAGAGPAEAEPPEEGGPVLSGTRALTAPAALAGASLLGMAAGLLLGSWLARRR